MGTQKGHEVPFLKSVSPKKKKKKAMKRIKQIDEIPCMQYPERWGLAGEAL